ncbi:DinB family protein [Maribacter halichondriae]|uniref:DinB family protein n=1 Tax=Maribacter halichondriae TaxID=2980554 RepID=UPI002358A318|nr:hypothetical protein [Maribacter sp. Hal144]
MKFTMTTIALLLYLNLQSQEAMTELPYTAIPEAPETYTAGTVVSRMIDGLGFRYHWATDGLTEKDLNYKPGNDGRTIAETMEHIHNLSLTILKSSQKQARDFSEKVPEMNMAERRLATLQNLEQASALFKTTDDLTEHKVIFKRGDNTSEFPFWNQINGPIEDAVWHAGQVVVLRRAAGNPMNPKVNVFLGKLND